MNTFIPVVMTIAGSDCSAGAGVQADLKTFASLRVFGLTALTCAVAETPLEVQEIFDFPPEFVVRQIRLMFESYPVTAIKTGLLPSAAHVREVAKCLREARQHSAFALVVDPVMVASAGAELMKSEAIPALEEVLFPLASLLTPNLEEAGALLKYRITREDELAGAAQELWQRYRVPILLKGGHLSGTTAMDYLLEEPGKPHVFRFERIAGAQTHGTGCTLSAAITAWLARGKALSVAVERGKHFVTEAIRRHHCWQGGKGEIGALDQSLQTARAAKKLRGKN